MTKKPKWDLERIRNIVLGVLALIGAIMGTGSSVYTAETRTQTTDSSMTRDDRMTDMLLYIHKVEERNKELESRVIALERHHAR